MKSLLRAERHSKQVFHAAADDRVRCVVVDTFERVAELQGDED